VEVPGYEQQVAGEPPESGPTHAVEINLSRKEYHLTLWEWVQAQLSLILKPFEEL
jgi:hypothetical protein